MDMPFRVTSSHGPDFKEYGIHNGAECVLKGWCLDDNDIEKLKNNKDAEVVLHHLPKQLYVQVTTRMKKPYPGLPDKWFPMRPVTAYWTLDADENIDIARRGYSWNVNRNVTTTRATT